MGGLPYLIFWESSKHHGMCHQGITVDDTLSLRQTQYTESKQQLVVMTETNQLDSWIYLLRYRESVKK